MYSNGGCKLKVEVVLRNPLDKADRIAYTIDVYETPMGYRWHRALQDILKKNQYLEKNFCFLGFPDSPRNLDYICQELTWAKIKLTLSSITDIVSKKTSLWLHYAPDLSQIKP